MWRALLVVSDSFVVCCLFSNDFFGIDDWKDIYIYIFVWVGWHVRCFGGMIVLGAYSSNIAHGFV